MRQVTVTYHHERGAWWAESEDLPGFSAVATSFEELKAEVNDGIVFHLDGEPVTVRAIDESGAALDTASAFTAPRKAWWSRSEATSDARGTLLPRRVRGTSSAAMAKT